MSLTYFCDPENGAENVLPYTGLWAGAYSLYAKGGPYTAVFTVDGVDSSPINCNQVAPNAINAGWSDWSTPIPGHTYTWSAVFYGKDCLVGESPTFEFTLGDAPNKTIAPSPSDLATGIPADLSELSWDINNPDLDPDDDSNFVTVYLQGVDLMIGSLVDHVSSSKFGELQVDRYIWRIDVTSAYGTTVGDTWTFDVAGYTPSPSLPGKPTTPSPANTATGITLNLTALTWISGS